ncbi:NrfD/PsrC family molybdoenzyme membrane anchor subunit, partial [Gordonia sp. UBA7599]|uniref:NrfD/PsrC family molybdoenzyme membrane anchor subunit n=1 Tax=Gordonia sp. UBA7599 TaxID=1946578 RepID=UPI0025C0388C
MTSSEYDQFRPPRPDRRGGRKDKGRKGSGWSRGADLMVPTVEVAKLDEHGYYGRPVVKAPPWEWPIGLYLFLGGVAGGSAVLGAGAQLTGRETLRRNTRLAGLGAASLGALALVADLGRPERFLHMMRTFKVTSPMSVGSWILTGYSGLVGVAAVGEVDRMTGDRLPLGPLRPVLRTAEPMSGLGAGLMGAPLAAYTAVLLGDTAMPTWHAAHRDLPFVFVSSASLAAGGLGMITTPVEDAGPARALAVIGSACELAATELMEHSMDPVAAEPLHQGTPGKLLEWSKRLVAIGGLAALVGGRNRTVAALSGVTLLTASALTRFGVLHAGIHAANDPRYTVVPQKNRLAKRRAEGIVDDSIT